MQLIKLLLWTIVILLVPSVFGAISNADRNAMNDAIRWQALFENNVIEENSTHQNTGVNTGVIHVTDQSQCFVGNCANDSVTTDHIVYSNIAAYQTGRNGSIFGWIRATLNTDAAGNQHVMGFQDTDTEVAGKWRWRLTPASDNHLAIFNVDGTATSGTLTIPDGTWVMIGFTYDVTKGILEPFVNLSRVGNTNMTISGSAINGTHDLFLGKREPTTDGSVVMFDEWEWYDIPLSDAQIQFKFDENVAGRHVTGISVTTHAVLVNQTNLTSEAVDGSLGQLVNISDPHCFGTGCVIPKTNDTTPTFEIHTNESATCAIIDNNRNLNFTDITDGSSQCSTTGGTVHTCTLDTANATGTLNLFNFSVGCKNADDNENQSSTFFYTINITVQPNTVNLIFDEVNDSRKYELGSSINISANCTGLNCQVEIDFDAPGFGFNFSSGSSFTSFIYNATLLRIVNFTSGPTSQTLTAGFASVNITSNNLTQIQRVAINITSTGTTTNLNLSFYGFSRTFRGDLKTIYLSDNVFIESNQPKIAVNITYLSAGSKFIFINFSEIDNPENTTFEISGFDLDADNVFSYTEHFNGTDGSVGFNETLSFHTEAPLGTFDGFDVNNSKWTNVVIKGNPTNMEYGTVGDDGFLEIAFGAADSEGDLVYSDLAADMRNSSAIQILFNLEFVGSFPVDGSVSIVATDGTNNVEMYKDTKEIQIQDNFYNVTFKRVSSDGKTWQLLTNDSDAGSGSNKDISSLDFDKQISIKFNFIQGPDITLKLHDIKWSGAWINYSEGNGTYKSSGNITSCIQETTTNVSKVTLTWGKYEPDKTKIDGFVTNLGNSSNPTFEPTGNGITHVFSTVGNKICYKFKLNSSSNFTSPIVRKVTVEVVKSSIENISIDIGNTGTIDAVYNIVLNSTTSPKTVNFTPPANQLLTIKLSADTAGTLQVNNLKTNSTINPIVLNTDAFEDCSRCNISIEFGGSDITVDGLEFDFFGSHNYTAVARFGSIRVERVIQIFYSFFNASLPSGLDFYDVFPSSASSKNVTPEGQNQLTPIWSVSNLAYDEGIDIYIKTNGTLNACFNTTFSNNTLKTDLVINESFVWINGTAVQLGKTNININSEVVFNQSEGGLTVGTGNYTINYTDGTITLNTSYEDRSLFGINYTHFIHSYDLNKNYTFRLNDSYQQVLTNITTLRILNFTQINESINITMESILITTNFTILRNNIVERTDDVRNATEPFATLNRDVDYTIDYTFGNNTFILLNSSYNSSKLHISYNFTLNTNNTKGIWNWWDLNSCSAGVELPYFFFATVCTDCVFDINDLDNHFIITE